MNSHVQPKPESAKGIRNTRQRQAVLQAFAECGVHMSADEVYMALKASHPEISISTVYRNLDILSKFGKLSSFLLADGTRKYERASAHHHHLVCIGCGLTRDIPTCPADHVIRDCSEEAGFQVVCHTCEVYGYCPECQAASRQTV